LLLVITYKSHKPSEDQTAQIFIDFFYNAETIFDIMLVLCSVEKHSNILGIRINRTRSGLDL